MKIGITINEVLRDFTGQLSYIYNKYVDRDFSLVETPVTEWDLLEYFKFKDTKELNTFLYTECSYEIFGMADQLHDNVVSKLNEFMIDINDYEEHEIILISREANKSIPATLFFLSKLGFSGNDIKFVKNYEDKWDFVDVLVTANPIALKAKPEGKISVKIDSMYNKDVESDYTLLDVMELFNNEDKLEKITTL
tara:strand:- start:9557 stop:10138 length:582 start_codon:yes stop_codon:yes gene_type:complete